MNATPRGTTEAASCFRTRTEAATYYVNKTLLPPESAPAPGGETQASAVNTRRKHAIRLSSTLSPCAAIRAPYPQTPDKDTVAVSFFHEFTPPTATAQSRRHTRSGATYPTEQAKRAAAILRAVCESHAPERPLQGPLRVGLLWTWPGSDAPAWKITRPDLDNLAKLALDAMTAAGYWQDDNQVCEFHTAKFVGPIPGLAVVVTALGAKQ